MLFASTECTDRVEGPPGLGAQVVRAQRGDSASTSPRSQSERHASPVLLPSCLLEKSTRQKGDVCALARLPLLLRTEECVAFGPWLSSFLWLAEQSGGGADSV